MGVKPPAQPLEAYGPPKVGLTNAAAMGAARPVNLLRASGPHTSL